METLAAIGLAGNIVQFIHFSASLVAKARDIHQSASKEPKELEEIQAITQDLTKIKNDIQKQSPRRGSLREIVGLCDEVAAELLSALQELQKVNPAIPSTKWKSFRQALKSVLGKDRIAALQSRMSNLRDQVILHMISGIR